MNNDVIGLTPGYISGSMSNEIQYAASQLTSIETSFRTISSDITSINSSYSITDAQ
jgi:hypothetical protein